MRRLMLLAATTAMIACSPPQQRTEPAPPPPAQTPVEAAACNTVTPDPARAVTLSDEAVAVASLPPELPGGPIAPGVYDLTSGNRIGGAAGWQGARPTALEVTEGDAGVALNWAQSNGAETERWTATFHQGPPAQLAFLCGRSGQGEIAFQASASELRLRMPDASGTGQLFLVFAKRG
jgi:hypothetical protein